MGMMLRPTGLLLPARRMMPNGRLRIDWSHPLANGLIGCWVPGVAGGIDLTGNHPTATTVGSGGKTDVTVEGPGYNFNATTTALKTTMTSAAPAVQALITAGKFSLYWRGYLAAAGGGFATLFGMQESSSGQLFLVGAFTGSGFNNSAGDVGIQMNRAGSSNAAGATSLTMGAGNLYSICMTYDNGANALNMYLNGTGDSNNPRTVAGGLPTCAGTPTLYVGGDNCGSIMNMGLMYSRALSADEMKVLDKDPYCFLTNDSWEMPALYLPSAAAPTSRQHHFRTPTFIGPVF
jgi:hypothetical protein